MQGESYFLTAAQIGMALGGFATLVAVFRRSRAQLTRREIAGTKLLLEHALGCSFFSLLPVAMSLSYASARAIGVSSSILALFLGIEFVVNLGRVLCLRKHGQSPRSGNWIYPTFFLPTVAIGLLQVLNCLCYRSSLLYAIAVLWLLMAGAYQFLIFVFIPESPKEPASGAPPRGQCEPRERDRGAG